MDGVKAGEVGRKTAALYSIFAEQMLCQKGKPLQNAFS
jgi:hypothetical protein